MSDISSQLIKDSYNYVLQSDLNTGVIYRIGGGVPVNPIFQSGLTVNSGFTFNNGSEQSGYVLTSDSFGNATWSPVSGSSSGDYLPLSGGTVTGATQFTSGLTANTISATTYFNLPSGLTCNDLSGCTIIQNIEQNIINIQEDYVPYTGATNDVNLSGYSINANSLNFYVDQNNNGSFGGVVSGPSFRKLTFRTLDSGSGFGLVDININPEEGMNFSIGDSSETSESKIFLNPETTEIKTSTSSYVHTLFLQNGEASLSVDDLGNVESNNITVLGSKTSSRKYIEAPGFEGNYANLNSLTSTTISATTYQNLPVDVFVTGVTKNDSVATFTNNTGGTFNLTGLTDTFVTGGTYSNGVTTFTNNSGGTFDVTGMTIPQLLVSDSSVTVTPVTGITFSGATITNNGDGDVTVDINLNELNGVSTSGVTDGDVLYYNGDTSLWETSSVNQVIGYVPAKINAVQTTGVTLSFTQDNVYGTLSSPETATGITANVVGALLGVTCLLIHNSGTAPTFSSEFKKLSGSGDYVTGQINYIFFNYITNTEIIYSINQRT